ncbi:MAG: DNA-binding response regulator [Paenibacillaceae bacterium]|jgi:DNA-binding response OmpR family regulator|nr:DNA-binding response regulator [Paenibacillaceae bacterium]
MAKYNLLVVDDDQAIREALEVYLKNEDMEVFSADNGLEALEVLERREIHLIIMDVMMPRMDGIKATHKIRESRNIPIIMLSAKNEDPDKILGLHVGADDYVTKPFNPLELIARVKSQLRRYTNLGNYQHNDHELQVKGLILNKNNKTVSVDGEEVRLTATEYKILELLMENKGRIFSIGEIHEKVWKEPFYNSENTVSVHIRRIREKIEINPGEPKYLKVVWGIGYKMEK